MILITVISINISFSQDRYDIIKNRFETLSGTITALNEKVNISVSDVSIQEFLRAVANSTKLNLSIEPSLNINVINNFSDVMVKDMLVFICKEYDLDISVTGNIISIYRFDAPQAPKPEYVPKVLKIEYDKENDLLSIELSNDSLVAVTKQITRLSEKNIVLAPGLNTKLVNGYIQNMPFDNVMEKFAFANDLIISKTEDNFFLITKKEKPDKTGKKPGAVTKDKSVTPGESGKSFDIYSADSITVRAVNTPIIDIITYVSEELNTSYCIISEVKGNATINLSGISYDELLDILFNGTEYTYKKKKNIYLIGEKQMQELKAFKVIQLQYRTVENIVDVIPADLQDGLEIKEFPDLNSILVTGFLSGINDIEEFIREIDKVVPVILIEVLIVDINKSSSIKTGINAGLGQAPAVTGGNIFPSVDFTLNSTSINNIINSFEGFGALNLGQVTPDFYVSLKALEDNGVIKIRSTPKLSALNGHEATMSIGRTEYYMEEQNNVIGTQNPQNITTRTYKPITADLSVTIRPFVSGDEQITLDIKVEQQDFTTRASPDAPYGSVNRSFQSLIRVKNQEMVLLGGLEEKSISNTGTGVPWISRVPVIKWLFSSRSRDDSKSKLNIFIKPTIIY